MPNTRRADLLHRHVDDVSLHLDALDLLDDMDLSTLTDNLQIEELQNDPYMYYRQTLGAQAGRESAIAEARESILGADIEAADIFDAVSEDDLIGVDIFEDSDVHMVEESPVLEHADSVEDSPVLEHADSVEDSPVLVANDDQWLEYFEHDIDKFGAFEEFIDLPTVGWELDSETETGNELPAHLDLPGEDVQSIEDFLGRMDIGNELEQSFKRRRVTSKSPDLRRQPRSTLHNAASSRGLTGREFRRMLICGLPLVLLNSLVFIQSLMPFSADATVLCAELFSGVENVAGPFQPHAAVFDSERNAMENLNSAEGFLTALRITRDIDRRRGFSHWATVCSTFVYLCRASTERSICNPLGNVNRRNVREANCMLSLVCIIIAFSACLRLRFLHEQPASSLASSTKYMLWLRNLLRDVLGQHWERVRFWMGAYGGPTQKPTEILTNTTWAAELQRPLSAARKAELSAGGQVVIHLPCDRSNLKRRVTGASGLKRTQAYPKAYGEEVHRLWDKNMNANPQADESESSDDEIPWDAWKCAMCRCHWPESDLRNVQALINVPSNALVP
jgi:hypothetical protein